MIIIVIYFIFLFSFILLPLINNFLEICNYFTEVIKSYLNILICRNNKKIQQEQMGIDDHKVMGFAIEESGEEN